MANDLYGPFHGVNFGGIMENLSYLRTASPPKAIEAMIDELPPSGSFWRAKKRVAWVKAVAAILDAVYFDSKTEATYKPLPPYQPPKWLPQWPTSDGPSDDTQLPIDYTNSLERRNANVQRANVPKSLSKPRTPRRAAKQKRKKGMKDIRASEVVK